MAILREGELLGVPAGLFRDPLGDREARRPARGRRRSAVARARQAARDRDGPGQRLGRVFDRAAVRIARARAGGRRGARTQPGRDLRVGILGPSRLGVVGLRAHRRVVRAARGRRAGQNHRAARVGMDGARVLHSHQAARGDPRAALFGISVRHERRGGARAPAGRDGCGDRRGAGAGACGGTAVPPELRRVGLAVRTVCVRQRHLSVQFGERVQSLRAAPAVLAARYRAARDPRHPRRHVGDVGRRAGPRRDRADRRALSAAARRPRAARRRDAVRARVLRAGDAHARTIRLRRVPVRHAAARVRARRLVAGRRLERDRVSEPSVLARVPDGDGGAHRRRRRDGSVAAGLPSRRLGERGAVLLVRLPLFGRAGSARRPRFQGIRRGRRSHRARKKSANVVRSARRARRHDAPRLAVRGPLRAGFVRAVRGTAEFSGGEDLRRDLLRPRRRGVSAARGRPRAVVVRVHPSAVVEAADHVVDAALRRPARAGRHRGRLAVRQRRGRRAYGRLDLRVREAAHRVDAVRVAGGDDARARRFSLRAVAHRDAGDHRRVLLAADALRVLPPLGGHADRAAGAAALARGCGGLRRDDGARRGRRDRRMVRRAEARADQERGRDRGRRARGARRVDARAVLAGWTRAGRTALSRATPRPRIPTARASLPTRRGS